MHVLTCLLEGDRITQASIIIWPSDVLSSGVHHIHVLERVICMVQ